MSAMTVIIIYMRMVLRISLPTVPPYILCRAMLLILLSAWKMLMATSPESDRMTEITVNISMSLMLLLFPSRELSRISSI